MEITVQQNNFLAELLKNKIPFIITGRYSYDSTIDAKDLDLLVPCSYIRIVNERFKIDDNRTPSKNVNPNRFMYESGVDILYLDEAEYDEILSFARTENGLMYAHAAHSMLAKMNFLTADLKYADPSIAKHRDDIIEYLRRTLNFNIK